jgi:protein gp37
MGDKTGISWTDASWNCIRGCSRVSEGCRHCYAETMAGRFSDPGQPYHGLVTLRKGKVKPKWNGKIDFIPKHLLDPLRWQKPRRIFVNSMSDIFHENLSFEHIAAIFAVMLLAKQHKFQVLTKRSKRMKEFFAWAGTLTMPQLIGYAYRALKDHPEELKTLARADRDLGAYTWPLPNVWLGVSVENQEAADERIPDLIACPAAVRFLSCEPLIGQVILQGDSVSESGGMHSRKYLRGIEGDQRIHWVIAGCESGPGMRPCDHRWLRSLRDQCKAAGTKYFLKQATKAQEGGHRLYPSGQAAKAPIVDVVKAGANSKVKPGGVIERPFLDGFQHQEFPA